MNWSTGVYIVACLAIPIVWGVIVNWIFDRFERRRGSESGINDYQI
ncbi:MAG: hypothetical protein KDA78_07540 [Planctomycetaceae bacterium]|nr:hypothetical protein [Planctomycetaceae bacterium]